jgi:two-component system, chemotaxis family, response regulator Rcp1
MEAIHVLLVEDNEGDIVLTLEAFEEAKFNVGVSIVRDGEQAVNFLLKRNQYLDEKTPDMIILDINLPRKNGLEVLEFIKTSESLMHIPVIMLTTSSSEKDIMIAYKNHANCFIIKPLGIEDFVNAIHEIENFWFSWVKLPKASSE